MNRRTILKAILGIFGLFTAKKAVAVPPKHSIGCDISGATSSNGMDWQIAVYRFLKETQLTKTKGESWSFGTPHNNCQVFHNQRAISIDRQCGRGAVTGDVEFDITEEASPEEMDNRIHNVVATLWMADMPARGAVSMKDPSFTCFGLRLRLATPGPSTTHSS